MVLLIIFLATLILIFGYHFSQMRQLINVYFNLEKDIFEKIDVEKVKTNQIQNDSFYLVKLNQKLDIIKKQIAVLEVVSKQ